MSKHIVHACRRASDLQDPRLSSGSQGNPMVRVYIVRVWRPTAAPGEVRVSVRAVEQEATHEFDGLTDLAGFLADDTNPTTAGGVAGSAQQ